MLALPVPARPLLLALACLGVCCGSPSAETPNAASGPAPSTVVAVEVEEPPAPTVVTADPPASSVPPPHALVMRGGLVVVTGRVVDEAGSPIAGATVRVSSEEYTRDDCTTDANGAFETTVPPTPALRLAASHPDYGEQWTDMGWQGWSRYDVIVPDVLLTLRRGVVLYGRLLDPSAHPRAHETLLLVPAYRGSGPRPIETSTDDEGRFTFPRAVLTDFELVARSIDDWHPETEQRAGDYLRIVAQPAEWLVHARAEQALEIVVEPLTLVPVTLRLRRASEPAARQNIDLWLRSGPTRYVGTMPRTDAQGRLGTVMERAVAYELWALPDHGERTMPWTEAIPPSWQGSVDGPIEIPITIP